MRLFLFLEGHDNKKAIVTDFDIKDVFKKISEVYPRPLHQVSINPNAVFPDASDKTRAYYYIQIITDDGEVVNVGLADRRFSIGRNVFTKGK